MVNEVSNKETPAAPKPEENVARRMEKVRDMRDQIAEIGQGTSRDLQFSVYAPARNPQTIWRMSDGEPVPLPEYMVPGALAKRDENGYMFTAQEELAPTYVRGTVKCFLHADSPERAAGVLEAVGLSGKVCPAGNLGSLSSKEVHGEHRHSQEWRTVEKHKDAQKEDAKVEREVRQLDATLALAERATSDQPTARKPKGQGEE